MDAPEIDTVLVELPYSRGPYGAKGVGESSLVPVAAVVANAVSSALGKAHKGPGGRAERDGRKGESAQ